MNIFIYTKKSLTRFKKCVLFIIKNTNMHSLWLNNMKTRLIQVKKKKKVQSAKYTTVFRKS